MKEEKGKLEKEIKQWENDFKKQHGRPPKEEDRYSAYTHVHFLQRRHKMTKIKFYNFGIYMM
jgi:hypothetical protein